MRRLEETALEFGLTSLKLGTSGFNIPAQRLYLKMGYVETKRYTTIDPLRSETLKRYHAEKMYMEKTLR